MEKITERKQQQSRETRMFISSLEQQQRKPGQWLRIIQDHWAGVEIRNHWRRDAIWMEDKTRSRNPNIAGALALLRNASLALAIPEIDHYGSLPAFTEAIAAKVHVPLRLICKKL